MTGLGYHPAMRTCPRCGCVDPSTRKADKIYDANRNRAAYMREYRARKKTETARKSKKGPKR